MKPHSFHPEAADEYAKAVEYHTEISSRLGERFYDEIERVIGDICRQPDHFMRLSPTARRGLARKFPFAVVFIDLPEHIWIVAVMHAKRRPEYWRQRF